VIWKGWKFDFFKNVISDDLFFAIWFKIVFFVYEIAMWNAPKSHGKKPRVVGKDPIIKVGFDHPISFLVPTLRTESMQ